MKLPAGTVHTMPQDLRINLQKHPRMRDAWNDITPLARNEFICWITSAKKPETRAKRIVIAQDKLERGERRPCCWIGCIHRTDKAPSATQKWATNR